MRGGNPTFVLAALSTVNVIFLSSCGSVLEQLCYVISDMFSLDFCS